MRRATKNMNAMKKDGMLILSQSNDLIAKTIPNLVSTDDNI